MVIGGVSTLLFNGNPLLRFDAYYMLSDYLEIPNLATKANRYVGYLFRRYLLNMKQAQTPASAAGEHPWLGFYAVASFIYRMYITIRIALFVAGKFFLIGFLLTGWGLFSMLVLPLIRMLRFTMTDPEMRSRRTRVLSITALLAALALSLILVLPFPSYTVAEGVIWAPENSRVHAGAHGFVKQVVASSGQTVKSGDPLIVCENPQLTAEVGVLSAQLREFESRHRLSMTKDRTEAEILMDEIGRIKAELERKRMEAQDLVIRSPADGLFLIASPEDLPDLYVRRGSSLGYIVDFSKVTARVVVPQRDVDRVRTETRNVLLRLSESVEREFAAEVGREVPAASNELPSLALSLEGGGNLVLDPREKQEPRSFETLFQFEILASDLYVRTIGQRVFVRFEHAPEPLAYRWYRDIRRTLMSRFNV
jgi:putative peptide zinc metalloprotease protein